MEKFMTPVYNMKGVPSGSNVALPLNTPSPSYLHDGQTRTTKNEQQKAIKPSCWELMRRLLQAGYTLTVCGETVWQP
jgi:hypothetical protein